MNPEVRQDLDHPTRVTRRVARNTLYLAVADIANKLMMFFFYLVAARHLGVERFGVLSFALAFVTMLAVFTDFGLGTVTARDIARDRSVAHHFVSNALAIKLVASLVVMLLIGILVNVMGYPQSTVRVVYICSLFVVESAFTQYFGFVFQGFERMEFTAITRVLQTLILIVGVVVLSRGPASAERYALLYAGAGLVTVVFAWSACSATFLKPGLAFFVQEWTRMLRTAAPLGVTIAFVTFYYWNGSALLSKTHGDAAVGTYSAAFRMTLGTAFLGLAFSGALYPLLSRLFVSSPQKFTQVFELALRYMTLLVLPVGVFGSVLARPVTTFVYGSGYEESAVVLRVVLWWGALACLNSLLSNYFIAIDRPTVVTTQSAVSLAINILGNVLLIPLLGALGAAVAIVCAEAGGFAFLFVRQLKAQGGISCRRYASSLLHVAAALAPSVVVARLAIRGNPVVTLALMASVYLIVLVATRGINHRDVGFMYAAMTTRRNDARAH